MDVLASNQPIAVFFTGLADWAAAALPHLLSALLLLAAGLWFASFLSRSVVRVMSRVDRVDATLRLALGNIVYYALVILVLVAVLGQLGIETTSILAALGAAGLAIGLALQGTLANVAAGFMLLWLRPFRVGDYIDAEGTAGTVQQIGLFSSELKSWDGIFLFVPNSELWNKKVVNYSRLPTRLLELKFNIPFDHDVATARSILMERIKQDDRVLADPAPQLLTFDLSYAWVVLALRVWTRTGDYWPAKWALTEAGMEALEASAPKLEASAPKSD